MKKFIKSALIALMTASLFMACSDQDDPEPVVAKVTFDPVAGEVAADTPVALSTTVEGASIYVTFVAADGTAPTAEEIAVETNLYNAEAKPVITAPGTLYAVAKTETEISDVVSATYTIAASPVKPGNPYSDIADGSACSLTTKIHFWSDVEEKEDHKGTVYYQFVAEGETSTLTASNYAEDGVATKYESSFYFTAPGTYYCIAVYEGAVSDIVTFTYTMVPGRSAGLAAAEKKIAAMTHVTADLPTADIKDGLIDAKDAVEPVGNPEDPDYVEGSPAVEAVKNYVVSDVAGLNKLAEIVADGNSLEGYTFTQVADIAFNDAAILNSEFIAESVDGLNVFAGIGAKGKPFAGTYDGNGYKISHAYIYAAHSNLAFVCETNATTVLKNIILDDVYVTPSCADDNSDDRAGGLIGKVTVAGTTINNCVVIGAVGSPAAVEAHNNGADGKPEHFGGLVGGCDKAATATDCLVVAKVTAYQGTGVIVASTKDNLTKNNVVGYDAALD